MPSGYSALLVLAFCLIASASDAADADPSKSVPDVATYERLPFGEPPVDYFGSPRDNPVEQLNRKLQTDQITLGFTQRHGYLEALLRELRIPVASQLLVFSKSAVNQRWVTPRTARAIYFNDEAYVAWIPEAPTIEVTFVDPYTGAQFYQLLQDGSHPPRLVRESRCLGCHVGKSTLEVPGLTARSFWTNSGGQPVGVAESLDRPLTTHATPLSRRWGGWYVTGAAPTVAHLGNRFAVSPDDGSPAPKQDGTWSTVPADPKATADLSSYLSDGSDIAAHLVFNHQLHGQNLLIRASYEARFGRSRHAETELLRYLLCVDEVPLQGVTAADSTFAEAFERGDDSDSPARPLRRLNLNTRLFEHRVSHLIDTPAFDALPDDVKSRIYRELWDVLADDSTDGLLGRVAREERIVIRDVLRAAKSDLPPYWRQDAGEPGGKQPGQPSFAPADP